MNKPLLHAFAAATLAVAAATPAHADKTTFLTLSYVNPGVLQQASFSDLIGYIGDFTDDYVFQSPPPNAFATFTGTAGDGTIVFNSVVLYTYGTTTSDPLAGTLTPSAFTESASPPLPSAVYVLEIKGTTTSATASYSGKVQASPVPEPASWSLMLLGLGAAGSLLRRRIAGMA
jgi:hypothetical protein